MSEIFVMDIAQQLEDTRGFMKARGISPPFTVLMTRSTLRKLADENGVLVVDKIDKNGDIHWNDFIVRVVD